MTHPQNKFKKRDKNTNSCKYHFKIMNENIFKGKRHVEEMEELDLIEWARENKYDKMLTIVNKVKGINVLADYSFNFSIGF
jgi:hypothetical protein